MKIGAHISAAGGADQAPINALKAQCECFQFFSRPPQGGKGSELTETVVNQFKESCKINNFDSYIHTPYYINLASSQGKIKYSSISVIREELERGSKLGVTAIMTHLGSSRDLGKSKALKQVIECIGKILDGYEGTARFLIENSAGGGGTIIGDTFDEISAIIKAYPKHDIGVCFDTCHAFVSGYDMRSSAAVKKMLKEFDDKIGLSKLQLIHANDAESDMGSRIDRHAHIGKGKIGIDGFIALMRAPKLKKINWILETPHDGKEKRDLKIVKELRNEAEKK